MNNDNELMDDVDESLAESDSDFEGEVYLSTDGKHTVHVKANDRVSRKEALAWAKLVYEALVAKYGTKQELTKKTYDEEEDLGKCSKCGAPNKRSQKGKVYCSAKCWLESNLAGQ